MQHSTPTLKAVGSIPVGQTTYYSRLQALQAAFYYAQNCVLCTICAPLTIFYASLLLKTTSAMHSAERLSASFMIWEYRSLVVLAFECPSLPDMLILSMPLK